MRLRLAMNKMIEISSETYQLLQQRATVMQSTPEQIAENVIRLQLGGMIHIEQRKTASGLQAYIRNTRVAVRHVIAFLKAGHPLEEIIEIDLPHLSPAAIYEAMAYYHDHPAEIDAELQANEPAVVYAGLQSVLSPTQFAQLTGQAA